MGAAFKYYKRRFRNSLQPLFVMLIHRKSDMDKQEWKTFVNHTVLRIKQNPQDFLGTDIPAGTLLSDIVDDIFTEFLRLKG